MSQFALLTEKRFGPFFVTQFLGALNDNLFKNALVVLVTYGLSSQSGASPDTLVNLAAGLFILPFFLFSATAGQLADKFEKATLIRRIKLAEIGIMVVASIGFVLGSGEFLIFVLFLMGTQSTFFGPVKYAILPQHLKEEELVGGNAMVETGTFLAILLGLTLGPLVQGLGTFVISGALIGVAVAGWVGARAIPAAPAPDPGLRIGWNFLRDSYRIIADARENRTVFLSIMGVSWFWLYGATFVTQMPNYAKQTLGGDEHVFILLVATFSLGIGLGSLLCERMSGRLIEIGLVPFGSIGLSVFAIDLALATPPAAPGDLAGIGEFLGRPGSIRLIVDLALVSVFGGFYIVPLYALIQQRSEPSHRSRIIAANNILNALFMVVAAGAAIGLLAAGLSIPELFLVIAIMNAAVAYFIFRLVPEFLMRFLVWLLVNTVYRLRVSGIDHVPDQGAAVLACNHVSFVDALIVTAACRRPIRFIMYHKIFALPILSFVFRTNRAIPIAPRSEDPELMERAFAEVAAALEAGELVGIFPEGMITETGELNPFKPGIERIVRKTPVPVVPLALRGLWGSFFSRDGGRAMSHPLRLITRLRSRIELVAGPPLAPGEARAGHLQDILQGLRGDYK